MNVIVICIDTLRWDALGAGWVETPALDAFACQATRFDMAFCASFPTVPMRVDAYTGNVNWPCYGWQGPDADQPTLPAIPREVGYYTGLVLDTANIVGAGLDAFYYDDVHLIEKDDGVEPEDIPLPVPSDRLRACYAGEVTLCDRWLGNLSIT